MMKTPKYNADDFRQLVFDAVCLIPEGRVTTYGAIAAAIGHPTRARAVGQALKQSKGDIPAHRVVNSVGRLSGKAFFGGNRMEALLTKEGVLVENDKVVDFRTLFWDPLQEI